MNAIIYCNSNFVQARVCSIHPGEFGPYEMKDVLKLAIFGKKFDLNLNLNSHHSRVISAYFFL